MDFEAFAAAFGVDPKRALVSARSKRRANTAPRIPAWMRTREVDPLAETKRAPLGPGGLTRGCESSRSQTTIFVSHDAPTGVHKGRRMRGILEQVRRYLAARAVTPPGLDAIFPGGKRDNVPDSVPCDGEYIVRCAAPGGGHPAFDMLPAAYSTGIPYLMRAIASLHTCWGPDATHVKIVTLIERIDKTLDRLRGDPREA